jgi:hypothetical protein
MTAQSYDLRSCDYDAVCSYRVTCIDNVTIASTLLSFLTRDLPLVSPLCTLNVPIVITVALRMTIASVPWHDIGWQW